jgi:ketosteroid isomerase-like protein
MEPSPELVQVMRDYLSAIATGDVPAIEAMLADEVLILGTDPAEVWRGKDENLRVFRAQIEEWGGGIPLDSGDPEAFVEGDAGWGYDEGHFQGPDGDLRFRLTSVFVRRDGRWQMVQSHASFGVPNEDSVGRELTA